MSKTALQILEEEAKKSSANKDSSIFSQDLKIIEEPILHLSPQAAASPGGGIM